MSYIGFMNGILIYYKCQQRKPFQGPFNPGLYPWYQVPDILPVFDVTIDVDIFLIPKIISTTKCYDLLDQSSQWTELLAYEEDNLILGWAFIQVTLA